MFQGKHEQADEMQLQAMRLRGTVLGTDSDETPLNGYMAGVVDFPQLKATDMCSTDDSLLSPEFLRSPFPFIHVRRRV